MIKTITDLTIRKWRDIDTYEITDESLIIETPYDCKPIEDAEE